MAPRNTGGRARAALFLLISLVAAVVAVLVVFRMLQSYQEELQAHQQPDVTIPVVVAKKNLYQGATLSVDDLEIRHLPVDFVPDTAFESVQELVGRVPAERIIAGEYVRAERLANAEAGVGMNAIIPTGKRAVSLNISDGSAVAGFLNPGNYVDVLASVRTGQSGRGENTETLTLLQAVQLLAVNNRMGGGSAQTEGRRSRPSVTLALTPEEAQKVIHAQVEGSVILTLRNDVDVMETPRHGVRTSRLIGRSDESPVTIAEMRERAPARPAAAPPPQQPQNLIIQRGSRTETRRVNPDGTTTRGGRR